MNYPTQSLRDMAQHPHLKGLWALVPELIGAEDWPDCAFWQSKFNAHPVFRQLSHPLQLFSEVKVGQRRKRRLTRQSRELGRPTLRRYETCIMEDHAIPMRERNLHDYFNSLIWLRFARSKYALHERAYRSYLESPPALTGNLRNELTDALTRFDEGGVVCFVESDAQAKVARELFRSLDSEAKGRWTLKHRAQFEVFGHGLLEVWNQGRRQLTASVLVVPCTVHSRDEALAEALQMLQKPQGFFGTVLLDMILDMDGEKE